MTTTWPWWLLALAATGGVLALTAGRRHSKYDGVPPRVWWEQQRMYRRPLHIIGRQLKLVVAAVLLVLTFAAGVLTATVVLVATLIAAFFIAVWWCLRTGARNATPHRYPFDTEPFDDDSGWSAAPPQLPDHAPPTDDDAMEV